MIDTPQHIKDLQLKLWMSKTEEERLLQFLTENEIMYQALRKFKIENNLPLNGLDPSREYLNQKNKKFNCHSVDRLSSKIASHND